MSLDTPLLMLMVWAVANGAAAATSWDLAGSKTLSAHLRDCLTRLAAGLAAAGLLTRFSIFPAMAAVHLTLRKIRQHRTVQGPICFARPR